MNFPVGSLIPFAPPADEALAPEAPAAPAPPEGAGSTGPPEGVPIGDDGVDEGDLGPVAAVEAAPMPALAGAPAPVYAFHPGCVVDAGRGLATFYGSQHYLALRLGPRPAAHIVGAPRSGEPPNLAVCLFSRPGPDGRATFSGGVGAYAGALGPLAAPAALDNCVPEATLRAVRAACRPSEDLLGLLLLGEEPALAALGAQLPVLLRALMLALNGPEVPEHVRPLVGRIARAKRGRALSELLLELLGFASSRAFIERLRRVDYPQAWSLDDLWLLQRTLEAHPSRVAALPRLSPVSAPLIAVAAQLGLTRWLRPSLFDDLLRVRAHAGFASVSVRALLERLAEHQRRTGHEPGPLRSMAELQAKAEHAGQALQQLDRPASPAADPAGPGIDPPLAFPPFLRPLRTAAAAALEGRVMAHCLNEADFAAVEAREAYFFAAELDGERATVMLRFEPGGILALGELRGPKNAMVSPTLRLRVEHWIVHQNLWTVFDHQPCSLPPPQPAPPLHRALARWGRSPNEYIPVLLGNPAEGEPPRFPDLAWITTPVAPRAHPGLEPYLLVMPGDELRSCYAAENGQSFTIEGVALAGVARRLGWRPPAEQGQGALGGLEPDEDIPF